MNFFSKGMGSKRHTLVTVNFRCKQTAQLTAKRLRFDMPKTSNFMAKTNTELYKSTSSEACDFQSLTTRFLTNFS